MALVLAPMSSALAASFAPQIWAIGNGHIIADVLMAARGLISETGYAQMIFMIALASFIFVATSSAMGALKPEKLIMYFIALVLITTVTFRARMDITVYDPVNATTDIVTDVPLIVAFPATLTSQVGDYLLRGVETFFSYPNASTGPASPISMHNSGQFNIVGQMISDGNKVKIRDRHLRGSISAYVRDCVVPYMHRGYIDANQVMHSKDLWAALYNNSLAMTTVYYSEEEPSGALLACGSPDGSYTSATPFTGPRDGGSAGAHERIARRINEIAPQLIGQNYNGYQNTDAVSFFKGAYASSYAFLTEDSGPMDTAEIVRNNAVINTYAETSQNVMSLLGTTEGTTYAINRSEALQSQKHGWQLAAEVFQHVVGYLYTVLQAFIMAIMPMCIVAFFIPSYGVKIAATLVKMMIWLAIWIPALGIVNFIAVGYLKNSIGGILAGGIDLANINTISERTENSMLAASFFATSVPLITWGLVSSGSFALTQFLAEGAGAMATRSAASNIASSSVSVAQKSYDNARSRSTDFAASFAQGFTNPVQNYSSSVDSKDHIGAGGGFIAGSPIAKKLEQSKSFSDKISVSSLRSIADSLSTGTASERRQSVEETVNSITKAITGEDVSAGKGSASANEFADTLRTSLSTMAGVDMGNKGDHTNSTDVGLSGGAGRGKGEGFKGGLKAGSSSGDRDTVSAGADVQSRKNIEDGASATGNARQSKEARVVTAAGVSNAVADAYSASDMSSFTGSQARAESFSDKKTWGEDQSFTLNSSKGTSATRIGTRADLYKLTEGANKAIDGGRENIEASMQNSDEAYAQGSAQINPGANQADIQAQRGRLTNTVDNKVNKAANAVGDAASVLAGGPSEQDMKDIQVAREFLHDVSGYVEKHGIEGLQNQKEWAKLSGSLTGGAKQLLHHATGVVDWATGSNLSSKVADSYQGNLVVNSEHWNNVVGAAQEGLDRKFGVMQAQVAATTDEASNIVGAVSKDGTPIPEKGRSAPPT